MKKTMLAFLLIASIVMLSALESDPSDVVGFVKYGCLTGKTFISLPMDSGFTMSNEVGDDFSSANSVAYYDNVNQVWVASTKNIFNAWVNTFGVNVGMPLMVNTTTDEDFYVAGSLVAPEPSYSMLIGKNAVMVPLSRTDLTSSDLVGDDMTDVEAVAYYDNVNKVWVASTKNIFNAWVNTFATEIAMPLLATATAEFTWPAPPTMGSKPSITNQNNFRK